MKKMWVHTTFCGAATGAQRIRDASKKGEGQAVGKRGQRKKEDCVNVKLVTFFLWGRVKFWCIYSGKRESSVLALLVKRLAGQSQSSHCKKEKEGGRLRHRRDYGLKDSVIKAGSRSSCYKNGMKKGEPAICGGRAKSRVRDGVIKKGSRINTERRNMVMGAYDPGSHCLVMA